MNVTGPSAFSLYWPVDCRDRERFVSRSKDGLWDSAVGDEVGTTIIRRWRKPSRMNHPVSADRGENHTPLGKAGYFRKGS